MKRYGKFNNVAFWAKDTGDGHFKVNVALIVSYEFEDPSPTVGDPWTSAEMDDWIAAFRRAVTEAWSGKFPLYGVETDFWFSFDEVWATVNVKAMHVDRFGARNGLKPTRIIVHRNNDLARSYYSPDYNTIRLTEDDVWLNANEFEHNRQVVAAHEFGHAIGFFHILEDTPGCGRGYDAIEDECYALAGSQLSADIMGRGMHVGVGRYQKFVWWLQEADETKDYTWTVGRALN
jgi:hypothetical protein